MQKGCIIAISILAIVIGITVMILYFTLGSGDNGGNNVNIDGKGEKEGNERGDNNIIQKTNQGGIHVFECAGQLHVNWQALMAMGMVIVVILVIKWGIQYNWCRVFTCYKHSESESSDRKRDKSINSQKCGDIELLERGHMMRQTDSSNDRLAKNTIGQKSDTLTE